MHNSLPIRFFTERFRCSILPDARQNFLTSSLRDVEPGHRLATADGGQLSRQSLGREQTLPRLLHRLPGFFLFGNPITGGGTTKIFQLPLPR